MGFVLPSDATSENSKNDQGNDRETNPLNKLGRKIFLDRYALKDATKSTLGVGDTVIVCVDLETGQREIGCIHEISGTKVSVMLEEDGMIVVRDIEHVDKPLEATPEQTIDRVARGIASAEEKPEDWHFKYKWLLEKWRFVPGGRILTAAGSDQQLSLYNCYVLPLPHDSREGIVKTLSEQMEIMSRGGGVGITLSSLRPRHAYVKGVNGRSSGSVSWGALYSFVTGQIEQGGCFAPWTRIQTNQGWIPVEEIVDRVADGESFEAWTHKGWKPITDVFRNGEQKVFRVLLSNGMTLDVTNNHKIQTMNEQGEFELIPLSELGQGAQVLTIQGPTANAPSAISLQPMSHPARDKQAKAINLPEFMDESLAYFVGYYMANGHVRSRKHKKDGSPHLSLAVPTKRSQSKQRLWNLFMELFGVNPCERQGDGAVEILTAYSKPLVDYFLANQLVKQDGSKSAFVPEIIWRSCSLVQAHFLAGYFDGDGCNRGKKGGFGWDTVSYEMAQSVQVLLNGLGIPSNLHTFERAEEEWSTIYRVNVAGSWACAKLVEWLQGLSEKVEDRQLPKKNHSNIFPHNFNSKYRPSMGSAINRLIATNARNTSQKAIEYLRNNRAAIDPDLEEHFSFLNQCVPSKIVSIEPIGEMQTYDLTVSDVHRMSADGVYVSNSRRGALMLILDVWHPDILEFVNAKRQMGQITNANISVGISDEFMEAVKADDTWELVFPDTTHPDFDEEWDGELDAWVQAGRPINVHKTVRARDIWNELVESAWASAEPGLWFKGRSNKMSNSHYFAPLVGCNPCGEQPLPGYSVCNLGSLNLPQFLDAQVDGSYQVNWNDLKRAVRLATRFLDNVIDINPYFIAENRRQQQAERRVGLGTMGIGEMMIRLKLRYGSKESIDFINELYEVIATEAYLTSSDLAAEKGSFTHFDRDKFLASGFMEKMPKHVREAVEEKGIRNVTLLTQPPTGTTGTMVNTSTGIEPFFYWEYDRRSRLGVHTERVGVYQEWLEKNGSDADLPDHFVTAMDLSPDEHVAVLAAIQRWVDSAISKTSNLPADYTVEQTRELYELMYDLGCKGGTIYRDKSRDIQVLNLKEEEAEEVVEEEVAVESARSVPKMRPRPVKRNGSTISKETPSGTAHITMNHDDDGRPFEVFIDLGKAGSDVQAMTEALGRMTSLVLRMNSPLTPLERVEEIVHQLRGIGGASSLGFGPNRVRSLADAVGAAMAEHYLSQSSPKGVVALGEVEASGCGDGSSGIHKSDGQASLGAVTDLCPSCGQAGYIRAGGCASCILCDYSSC